MARTATRRRGTTVVETAIVLSLLLTVMMGIFEYGRFLMVYNVARNAARTGARYAVVQLTSSLSTSASQQLATQNVMSQTALGIAGLQGQLQNPAVDVARIDATQPDGVPVPGGPWANQLGPTASTTVAVVTSSAQGTYTGNYTDWWKTKSLQAALTEYQTSQTTGTPLAAPKYEMVRVTVRGTYKPMTGLLFLPAGGFEFRVQATMSSEAN